MTLDELRGQIVTINDERCVMLALPVLGSRLRGPEQIKVRLQCDEGAPVPDAVLRSVLDLVEREAQVAEAAHDALWLHYQGEVDELRRVMDSAFRDVDAPLLADRSELTRLVKLSTVYAHEAGEDGGDFGLMFSATWEQEHGVGVRLWGGRAAGVGGDVYAFEHRAWVEHSIAERLGHPHPPLSQSESQAPATSIMHARRGGKFLLFAGVVLVVVIVGIVRGCLGP